MFKRVFLAATLLAPAALVAADTVQARASATILSPLNLEELVPMNFGRIMAPQGAAGTVTLNTADAVDPSAGLVADGAGAQSGQLRVTGATGRHYRLEVDPHFDLTREGGAEVMRVDVTRIRFGSDADNNSYPLAGLWNAVPAGGTDTLHVAGSLIVAANQAPGEYRGEYRVRVVYE